MMIAIGNPESRVRLTALARSHIASKIESQQKVHT